MDQDQQKLAPNEIAYIDELAAEIIAMGGFGTTDVQTIIESAHARRRAFAVKMLHQKTVRSRIAKEAIQNSVYAELCRRSSIEKTMRVARDLTRDALMDGVRQDLDE